MSGEPLHNDELDDDGIGEHLVTFGMLAPVCMVIAAGVLIAAPVKS